MIRSTVEPHGRDQPISTLRNRLDDSRRLRIVPKYATQFGDGASEDLVADERVGPDRVEQVLLRDLPILTAVSAWAVTCAVVLALD